MRLDVPPVHVQGGARVVRAQQVHPHGVPNRIRMARRRALGACPSRPRAARAPSRRSDARAPRVPVSRLPRASSASCPPRPAFPRHPRARSCQPPPAPPLTLVRAPSPPRPLARRCSWCTTRRVTFGPISSALPSSSPSPSPWPPDGARTTCPHSRTRGSPARTPRAALVARTVRFRLGVEGSRAALSSLAAQLRGDGSHLFEWTHANPYPRPEHGERDEDDGGDRRAPNVGSPPLERDASDAEGWNGGGADDAEGNDDRSDECSPSSSSSSEAFHARAALGGATDALLAVAHRLLHHLHAPDAALLPHTRDALSSAVEEARGAARRVALAVESAASRLEDAARAAASGRGGRDRSTRGIVGECARDGAGDARDACRSRLGGRCTSFWAPSCV